MMRIKMPLRHEGTKKHKEFFVKLSVLVPLWQKFIFI